MAKKLTRSKSVKTHLAGWSAKIRDAESPGAPTRVSSDAQARNNDRNHAKKFEFARQDGDGDRARDRPSTSGDPGTNSSMQKKSGKRETKDDLYFNPLRAHVAVNDLTMTYFTFPAPNSPTPVSPPKSSPLPPRKNSVRQVKPKSPESKTPDKARMNVQQPEIGIGMALGSPTHLPVVGTWHSQIPFESASRSLSPDTIDNSTDGGTAPAPITKSSKWKILGGFFGGAKKPQPPFYQLQHEVPDSIPNQITMISADPAHAEIPSSSEKKPKPRRGKTISERKPEMRKPVMKRANTTPLNFEFETSKPGNTQVAPPEIQLDGNPMASDGPKTGQSQGHQGSLLDVDIPSIQMERYSIMFGSVLQKPTNSSSTLLARRQATLDKLNMVNEALALKEKELDAKSKLLRPRRGTSPQPTKSPALSLFPSTPSKSSVRDTSEPPPLSRSNTSPAALSPSRPSFPKEKNGKVKLPLSLQNTQSGPVSSKVQTSPRTHIIDQMKEGAKASTRSLSKPSPKASQPRNWSTEETHLDSLASDDEPILAPMQPKLDEGTWPMVTSHHPASLSVSSSNASGSDVSNSGASTATTPPNSAYSTHKTPKIQPPPTPRTRARSATTSSATRPKHIEIIPSTTTFTRPKHVEIATSQTLPATSATNLEKEERLKTAANVSIARQISISRDQRKLLVPVKSTSNSSLNNKFNQNQNFPSPISVARSPLAAVAAERTLMSSEGEGKRNGSIGEVRAGLAVHRVTVRSEKGAGITVGPSAQEFFSKHDILKDDADSVPSPGIQFLDEKAAKKRFMERPMQMSTCSTLYYRLRANFDGLKSDFGPNVPEVPSGEKEGKGEMKMGVGVTGVRYEDERATASYTDISSGEDLTVEGDQVIAGDGASSAIRQILMPDIKRTYVGYLGWRGFVPELEMSEEARKILDPEFISSQAVMDNLLPGHRRFNWVSQCPNSSPKYTHILTDTDNILHHNSILRGKLRPEIWVEQLSYGKAILNLIFTELITKTPELFISVIQDYAAPQASFFRRQIIAPR